MDINMRSFKLFMCVSTLLALLSGTTMAANLVPDKLSLPQAVSLALGGNANLKSSELSHLTSLSKLRTAGFQTTYGIGSDLGLEHTPDDNSVSSLLFGNVTYKNQLGTEASVDLSPLGTGSNRGGIGLQIKHPLMRGKGSLSPMAENVKSAQSDVNISSREYHQSGQDIAASVIRTYYNAVLAKEEVSVQEKAVGFAQAAYDSASKREQAGLIAGIEVTRAETSLAQTKDGLQIQRQFAKGAIDRLMLAIGFGVGTTPELVDNVPEPDSLPAIPSIDDAIHTALKNRSELGVYDTRLSDQQRRLALAEDQLKPALNLVAGYNSTNRDSGAISSSLFSLASFSTGVQLTFPLDMRTAREERKIAERGLDVLKDQRTYKEDQIADEIRSAYRSLESAKTSISIYSQNLNAAEERLHMAQRMLEEGLGSNREELEAREALIQVQSSLLSAKKDYYLASVDLSYAMGEDITRIGLK